MAWHRSRAELASGERRVTLTWMVDDNGPWYDGLIEEFDREHRGLAVENHKHVVSMRMRGHGANDFPYDVRYEPYITRLGLLPFVLQFKRNPPPVNHEALTTLTDRWRPKTHSFYLACGDMTMTLEDMAMISGLPLNGDAVTGDLDQASTRTRGTSSLCGFVWSLCVWMWERLRVGWRVLKNHDKLNPIPHRKLSCAIQVLCERAGHLNCSVEGKIRIHWIGRTNTTVATFTLQTSPHQHCGVGTSFSLILSNLASFHVFGMSSWSAHDDLVMEPDEAMPTK
ncbi:Alpha-L-arabinofuranosidase 1 [Hordeum vulgare]|nr:Alpha-L-arabinofuranosidase 1 [Hordeum vulgare]